MGLFYLLTVLMELLVQMSVAVGVSTVTALVATPFLIRRIGILHTFLAHIGAFVASLGVFFLLAMNSSSTQADSVMAQGDLQSMTGVLIVSVLVQVVLYVAVVKRGPPSTKSGHPIAEGFIGVESE